MAESEIKESETTLMSNVSYVHDLRRAIDKVPGHTWVWISTPLLKGRLYISEVTLDEKGEVTIHGDMRGGN